MYKISSYFLILCKILIFITHFCLCRGRKSLCISGFKTRDLEAVVAMVSQVANRSDSQVTPLPLSL